MLATAWRMDRLKTVVSVALMVAGAAAAPILAAALGWMTDQFIGHHTATAALAGVCVAALAIAALTFSHFAHIAYFELSELAEVDFDDQLIGLSNGSWGIEHHERPEQADSLTVLQQESRRFQVGLQALLTSLGLALAVALTAVLLALQSPWLLLLPLAALPPLWSGRAAERILDRARTAAAEQTRVALNLFHLATAARYAGELRVFRLQDELRHRHKQLWTTATGTLWRSQIASSALRIAGQLVFAVAYVGAVLLVVRDAVLGRRSTGDVVIVIVLAAQVNQQVTTAVTLLRDLQRMASTYRRLAALRAAVSSPRSASTDHSPPERLRAGIELDGVSFTYPGTDMPVLRDVDLTIPAGGTVAIVGENGAGKTTLVKLLSGFYQPSAGQIMIDGVDMRRIPIEAWRARIAAGFQDFARYEMLVRNTVGVGDLEQAFAAPAVRGALERAQATDVLDHLAGGLETQLGKTYADGAELSGGQWQKLALGRAMMREAPLLLILDEPTAALDAEAEHALFERYAEQAKRVGQLTGAITLLVSHRFSTVRMADLIIVVQDGRVTETGSHKALAASGGLYAELFAIQAAAYR